MGLVDTVREQLPKSCFSQYLDKDGCSVSLRNAPRPRLIVDFDKHGSPLGPNEKRCDYLLVADPPGETGCVVTLEFKGGSGTYKFPKTVEKVVGQLRAGACAAEKLIPEDAPPVNFFPVAVFSASKFQRKELKSLSSKVQFRGSCNEVRLLTCGDPLAKALRS